MTDSGSAHRSRVARQACRAAGLRHRRTKPCTPRTNGKAERFIPTVLRECTYVQTFTSSQERADALVPWTNAYDQERPHTAFGHRPPITRLQGHEQRPC